MKIPAAPDAAHPHSRAEIDRASRHAALSLALTLPGDVLLYLLLPLHAAAFGVTLPEVGLLLAANRLVRIVGYRWVARFYSQRGACRAVTLAVCSAVLATLGYATLSGVGPLLIARLAWGLSFAALNIANQAFPTALLEGAARRAGRARAIVAVGPMAALLAGALIAERFGPRPVFAVLALVGVGALAFARRLPAQPEGWHAAGPRIARPEALDVWSFTMGLVLDGLFIFGLSLLAAQSVGAQAALAAGAAMALRYAAEIVLAPAGGALAHRFGARPMLIALSLGAAGALALLGSGGVWLWIGAIATTLLRALLQPLPGPVVAEDHPGPGRVPALARQATWRDIGAGTGPLLAGLLLPVAPAAAIYGVAALLLAVASVALGRRAR
ncbi:MAG TPA: MFS transporter [Burkholderiaceae bacterium]|nr:MFS transporter [Burkholderiaceae bacterium]